MLLTDRVGHWPNHDVRPRKEKPFQLLSGVRTILLTQSFGSFLVGKNTTVELFAIEALDEFFLFGTINENALLAFVVTFAFDGEIVVEGKLVALAKTKIIVIEAIFADASIPFGSLGVQVVVAASVILLLAMVLFAAFADERPSRSWRERQLC